MNDKVGLAIVTYTINYGTYLQAFATQTAIRNLGYDTEILNIDSVIGDVSKARKKYFLSQVFNFAEVKSYSHTIAAIVAKKINPKYRKYILAREKSFKEFHDNYFKIGPICNSWDGLANHCREFSSVVVGSDQLWRPANIAGNFYTLNFVPEEINKISYATSFGLKEIRKNQESVARNFLSRINYLSTREASGAKIIKKVAERDAKVVCDPTLLLSRDNWEEYINPTPIVDGKYIFVYLLSSNKDHRKYIKEVSKRTGCKIVGVLHGSGYIHGDDKFVDEYPTEVGPFEFLNLIKNASLIYTDSFHGCVFSILLEKEFYAFKRFSDTDKMSTNSRVTNLLTRFGLETRIVEDYDYFGIKIIEYDVVNKKVDKYRFESMEYLVDSLKKGEMDSKDD